MVEDGVKINLYITDKFSIKDFNIPDDKIYMFTIRKISANLTHEILCDKDYYRMPHLTQEPCKKVYKHTLECDLTNNFEDHLLIEQGCPTLCIAMDKELNPEYYFIE